jgi:hypothetical protein
MPIQLKALITELQTKDHAQVVRDHLLTGDPHVFSTTPSLYFDLKAFLASQLSVPPEDVRIIGSAMMGYSLSPDSYGRAFLPSSDVDVVVVDSRWFDTIWDLLLDWRYPWHLRKWPPRDHEWAVARLEDFICGSCTPHRIRYRGLKGDHLIEPLRDISNKWFDTLKSLGNQPGLRGREYNGRLYRTWDHAIRYHVYGLREILRSFTPH